MKAKFTPCFLLIFVAILLTYCSSPLQSPVANTLRNTPKNTQEAEETAITLIFPQYPDESDTYYYELLKRALAEAGNDVTIERTPPLPQQRAVNMLNSGEISLIHLLRSDERDQQYLPIAVNLTNRLIGNRILLVPPDNQDDYANVKNLQEFKDMGKVGAFGNDWFDAEI